MEEKEKVQIIEKSDKIQQAVEEFIKHLESLADTFPIVSMILRGSSSASQKKFNDFLKNECLIKDEKEGIYTIPADKIHKSRILRRKVENAKMAEELVPRNFVVSLVSEFDAYLGRLIRAIYYLRPELLNASEKNLSFAKLVEFTSIDDAREYLIEKEVETVLRDSHSQQFKWLESKLDVKLTADLESWSTFIELTERRNLFVHNNGIINNQYISICNLNKVQFPSESEIGDQLTVTGKYFLEAYKCIFEIGVKLSQVIWRKLLPGDNCHADESFISIVYDQIVRKDYMLAIELAEFSTHKVIKHYNEDLKLTCIINKAQAYKWGGDQEKCKEIISSIDWSAKSDKFRLVSSVLLDDFDKAAAAMKRLSCDSDDIIKQYYHDWPIFMEFRKSKKFLDTYVEVFGSNFEYLEIEDKVVNKLEQSNGDLNK